MKSWRIVTVLLLCLVLVGTAACNPFGNSEEEANQQLVEVMPGDLTVTVNGIGNLVIPEERTLSFSSSGKVEKIYIEEGDEVTKGDVLAKLDTNALELALTQAQVALSTQQVALTEQQVALTQAHITLQTAGYELNQTQERYLWADIETAQADVDEAERELEEVLWKLSKYNPGSPDYSPGSAGEAAWQEVAIYTQLRLNAAKDRLEAMLSGTDPEEVAIKRLRVEAAGQSLELARQSLEKDRQSLEEAQQSLEYARKELREATLAAPFGGVVASIVVDEGDSIEATTEIIHLVDLASLELEVEVDEIDILGVKLGQRAIVSIDALPGVELGGKVTFIPPLSRDEPGLILYDVKISFDVPQDLVLRGGMSATADIVIDERSSILLVPNQAITLDDQGNPVVLVMVAEQTEERKVATGISDSSHTEILRGLDEGEVVVVIIER